ncbi:MAG: autotransporter-associated beta strand repeat-containing protein [Prevotella sp.]|nr:autotransporter-associated beta strand repeat-containing protein [Prevotella sp.]
MKKLLLISSLLMCAFGANAQRATDKLDRGLVAVPAAGSGNFVSWKIFGEEYYDTKYNLYRDGVKVNQTPLSVSNFNDTGGNAQSTYQVAPVVRGVEQAKSAAVARWANQYYDIPVAAVEDRNGSNVTSQYIINDMSLGDVDGDGVQEFIIKRNYSGDILSSSNTTKFHHLECYNMKGQRLWWIDCGPNLMAGADEQWDIVAFDWDEDGKAEALMRGADNMIIHTATGKVIKIGNMSYVAPRTEYTHDGAEYLLYLNGLTGEPYDWDGTSENYTPMAYPLPRFETGETDYATVWGSADTGHRSSKHYFGAPYLDGRHPSIFLGRGCYTRHKMCALDVDPLTHKLKQRWRWNEYSGSSPWFGNGFHNFAIADVDWDGRDEIVFGSMIIDDNGRGLCTTGLGHGDAQHCADLDPYRHGQEQFTCNETRPACTYWNATTGKIYYRLASTSDDGRALCANFSNEFPGSLGRSTQTGLVSTVADKVISGGPATGGTNDALYWSHLNFRIYWDGDLLDEVFDSPGSNARNGAVYKPGGGRLITFDGTNTSNSSKNNPGAVADIFGDWREEVVMRSGDTAIRIFTTNTPTNYGIYTLWHDHQYRNAMVWQSVGYNQPPHKSYFLGEMEGITMAPPPFTTVGRSEVAGGGTIDASLNDKHVLVCETNDTQINVVDGAQPYIATFNVPSWIQGTNSNVLNGTALVRSTYYTCTVTGGAFTGGMRLVKQGDGVLTLPAVDQTYTGETNIWAGTLNFDGSMLQSPVWLNRFAELNSNGGRFRSIRMDYDSKLRPGGADQQGSISTDTLRLGFGSRVIFDLYSDQLQADQVNVAKWLNIETKSWQYGPKYLSPVFEFVCHKAEGEDMAQGSYLLGEVKMIGGSLGDIRIEGVDNKQKSSLQFTDGKLYLVIEGMREASDVVWTGNLSNVWDVANTENFTPTNDATGSGDIFVTGDVVRFDDTAKQFTVTLNGDIEPDSIIVDNTTTYIFNGTGSIVGNTALVKRGSGTLTINTDNSFTGGTRIEGGAIAVRSLANTNQALGNLGGVVPSANKFAFANGGELRTLAAVTQGSPMRMETREGGVINNTADFVVDRAIYGTYLTKKGNGWMKLNVANPSLERLVIAGGTVQCVNCNQPAQTVEFRSGTLSENTSSGYAIEVAQGGTGTWNLVDRGVYTNRLTGTGTITIYCPVVIGSGWAATRTQIQGNWSAFEGTVTCAVHSSDTRFTLDNSYGMPKATLNIPAGIEVQNSGKTFRIGKVNGTGALGGSCTFSNGASVGANTWQVGNDADWTMSATVTSNANLVKMGSGKVTMRGASNHTGTTTVSEGELALSSGGVLGTGLLTVATGGTLTGTNSSQKPLQNSSCTINGTLRPGLLESSYSGTIFFGGKNVTIPNGGTLQVRANQCASQTNAGCTTISNIKKLTLNGTIRIHVNTGNTLAVGDSIRIFTAESFEGNPQFEMLDGITWDTSRISEGLLFVRDISTGVQPVVYGNVPENGNAYDLQGRKMTPGQQRNGLYIYRGRKYIVK